MNKKSAFVKAYERTAQMAHQCAVEHGFWSTGQESGPAKIALMHSELSEALEAMRHGNPPDDKIPDFSGLEAEFADLVIRVMDYGTANVLRIAEAIEAKIKYNSTRPYKHRKAF